MRAKEGDFVAMRILFCESRGLPYENAPSFRADDDFIDDEFVGLSEPEPEEWGRSPPGESLFDLEGGEVGENVFGEHRPGEVSA